MANVLKNRGWLAAFAAAILCLSIFAGAQNASAAGTLTSLKIGSATTAPNGDVTVHLTASGTAIGSYAANIKYDTALVTATACTSAKGACNITFAADTVRINGADTAGLNGTDVELGSITFHAGGTTGVANLTFSANDVTDTDFAALTTTPTPGTITITAATNSPAPTTAPTAGPSDSGAATPTKTPSTLPQTGGPSGDSFQLGWLFAVAGLVVVAGGAWTLSRSRQD